MKKSWVAYMLLIFLGGFGAHEIYLKETKWFLLRLLAPVLLSGGISRMVFNNSGHAVTKEELFRNPLIITGFIIVAVITIKTFFDLFMIPSRVKKLNGNQKTKS